VPRPEFVALDLKKHAADGKFSHVWQPSYEFGLDELGARLLSELERTGAKRLVIDSLDGFRQAAFDPAYRVLPLAEFEPLVRATFANYPTGY